MKRQKVITAVIVIAMLFSCFGVLMVPKTAFAKGKEYGGFFLWSEARSTKNGVWQLRNKHQFTIKYQAKTKGTYKVELWKTNSKGKKKAYIGTYRINANKKVSGYYMGYIKFKKASSKTYYRIFARSKGTIPSAVGRTK